MFFTSRIFRHNPMICFTFARLKMGGGSGAPNKATSGAVSSVLESVSELPARLRPRVISEEEMEIVMMGGATPYASKSLARKAK